MRGRVRALLARRKGDDHLNVLVELAENPDQPVEREAAKLRVANAGKLRMGNAGELFRVARRKFALVENADNLRRDDGARLFKAALGRPKSR